MNAQEFLDYVGGFKKSPGMYTTDEQYQIALAYKTLPQKEKDFTYTRKWLVYTVLGLDRTVDGFFSRVNKKYNRELKNITKGTFNDEKYRLGIAQTQNRDLLNEIRRNNRDDARIDSLKKTMIDTAIIIGKNKTFPILDVKLQYEASRDNEAILMFSDLHLGTDFDCFYNKVNETILTERVNKLIDQTIAYCKINKVHTLHFLNLGDNISGIIHNTIRISAQMDIVDQIIKASELISSSLDKLSRYIPEVTYRSVTDNHSRSVSNKGDAIEKENFNRLIDFYVSSRLENSRIKFPNDNLDVSLGQVVLKNGKKILFSHGHQDSVKLGLQNTVGAIKELPYMFLMGHVHSSSQHSYQNLTVLTNGSIVGTDDYALSKRLFSEPKQKLLVFSGNNLVNIDINLGE